MACNDPLLDMRYTGCGITELIVADSYKIVKRQSHDILKGQSADSYKTGTRQVYTVLTVVL